MLGSDFHLHEVWTGKNFFRSFDLWFSSLNCMSIHNGKIEEKFVWLTKKQKRKLD